MTKSKRPKIGLALGSGSAKGLAHIGVIKVLEENNIPIDYIAGSSIGAMIGGTYAAGLSPEEIQKIALGTDWRKLFSLLFEPRLRQGLIGGGKLKKFIEGHIDGKEFKDCRIPFAAVATNLKTGETVVLDKGKISEAIKTSISIPLIFKPVEREGKLLADGGLSAPVPVEVVRNMGADIVIAVNLDKHYYDEDLRFRWYDIANDSINILRHHLSRLILEKADIVIDINVGKVSWFNLYKFVNGRDKILAGERATKKILPQLKKIVS